MPLARLLLVLLILLQSGLAGLRAHAHPDCAAHAVPHAHTGHLLDLLGAPDDDADGEGDHDADALDLSAALPPAPTVDTAAAGDLTPPPAGLFVEAPAVRVPADPPPLASGRPRHLTFCVLTI
jgi:hypothetical protein